jgi:acetoin utilization deacetylase AcuC-like enzyme
LYTDPCFLDHETGAHPECAERLRRVNAHLREIGLATRCELRNVVPIAPEHLERVHEPEYAAQVCQLSNRGGGLIEADTVLSERSYDVALRAAGAACDAVQQVVRGAASRALCLVRPPGHHSLRKSAMGFCLFNNVAIAARMAIATLALDRVLIVDWDVHHGNGTQDTFWEDEQVGFLSAHRFPFYPGTGGSDETGSGPGLGTTLNLPITFGMPRREYLQRFASELAYFADKLKPQLVIISAGFDSHRLDPVGSLGLEVEDFGTLTRALIDVANDHAEGRLVSVLEGGYNLDVLPLCVAEHLKELLKVER